MTGKARASEYHEGPDSARRFEQTMTRILSVSKDELNKREAEYQKSRKTARETGHKKR